jgi:TRAP-type transport system small permease protein
MDMSSKVPSFGGRERLRLFFQFMSVVAFVVMFGSTLLSVIARYFGFGGAEWSFEVASIAFIWITFIGVVNAEAAKTNVAFEAINQGSPPKLKALFDLIAAIVLLTMGVAFLISGWAVWQRSWMVPTSVLRLPTGVITATVLILGLSVTCIAISRIPNILASFRGKREKAGIA